MTGVFQAYQAGRPYQDILEDVEAHLMKVVDRTPNFDIGELTDYEALKPKLMMQVIPQKGNEDRLEIIPHQKAEDMALIYRLDMGDSVGGKMTSAPRWFPCCPACLADLLIYKTETSSWGTALNWSRVDRVSVRLFT